MLTIGFTVLLVDSNNNYVPGDAMQWQFCFLSHSRSAKPKNSCASCCSLAKKQGRGKYFFLNFLFLFYEIQCDITQRLIKTK